MSAYLRQTKPLGNLMERVFSAFSVGKVKDDADEANRSSRAIVEKPAERREPANLAIIGPDDAVFRTIERARRPRLLHRFCHLLQVVGVYTRAPHLASHRP